MSVGVQGKGKTYDDEKREYQHIYEADEDHRARAKIQRC